MRIMAIESCQRNARLGSPGQTSIRDFPAEGEEMMLAIKVLGRPVVLAINQ